MNEVFTVYLAWNDIPGEARAMLELPAMACSIWESVSAAVSVKDAENGSIVYQREEKKLLHPASTLKIFTTYAALDTLGYDYEFKTSL